MLKLKTSQHSAFTKQISSKNSENSEKTRPIWYFHPIFRLPTLDPLSNHKTVAIRPKIKSRTSDLEKWHVSGKAHGMSPSGQKLNFELQIWKNDMFLARHTECRHSAKNLISNFRFQTIRFTKTRGFDENEGSSSDWMKFGQKSASFDSTFAPKFAFSPFLCQAYFGVSQEITRHSNHVPF